MKALLLIDNDRAADLARFYLRPLGFEPIRYRSPLKALDNLDEIVARRRHPLRPGLPEALEGHSPGDPLRRGARKSVSSSSLRAIFSPL